jgi:hypothetical protein
MPAQRVVAHEKDKVDELKSELMELLDRIDTIMVRL